MKHPALIAVIALGGATAARRRRRATIRRATFPNPDSFILELPEAVTARRTAGADILIRWPTTAAAAHIYAGPAPDMIEFRTPAAIATNAAEVVISGLAPDIRYWFEIVLEPGTPQERRLKTAERIIPLASAPNLRDLGGYQTADGRMVRWGQVYRSSLLARLTDADQTRLSQLGLKLVCDLRSDQEVAADPDRLPPELNSVYQRLPIDADRSQAYRLWTLLFNHRGLSRLLLDIYRHILDDHAAVFRAVFERLAVPQHLPALIHCTAGKDRAGLTSALLLLALGVPETTVLADYTQSNAYFTTFREYTIPSVARLAPLGITVDDMQPLLVADPTVLAAALAYLRERYGSLEAYLRDHVGVSAAVLTGLRDNLLEPPG